MHDERGAVPAGADVPVHVTLITLGALNPGGHTHGLRTVRKYKQQSTSLVRAGCHRRWGHRLGPKRRGRHPLAHPAVGRRFHPLGASRFWPVRSPAGAGGTRPRATGPLPPACAISIRKTHYSCLYPRVVGSSVTALVAVVR
ncbi:hypothetical protein HaLaN_24169 [Haematococcus lacustris]|uniref:Uncharacterized protein n=1 Tax=Haematococcus lacustris TaxID=44745 RepID=A0A6A0A4P9_HAELA|nr:hypothetical protein HaLaN_24169 [Haematococcus lacustris]